MKAWFIADRAINSADQDEFDHDTVAAEVVSAIRTQPFPICVGLLGAFGTGKTSIANLAMTKLGNDPDFDAIRVTVDRHSGAARSRNLVNSIAAELIASGAVSDRQVRNTLRPLRSAVSVVINDPSNFALIRWVTDNKRRLSVWLPAAVILVCAPYLAFSHLLPESSLRDFLENLSVIGLIGGAGAILWAAIAPMVMSLLQGATVHDATPRAEASDDVERVFADLVALHSKGDANRRLVIFVDDVDRLDADDVLEALRSIKSLQAVPRGKEPIFVVSCDERILIEAIATADEAPAPAPSNGDASPLVLNGDRRAAKAFLDKFFNIRIVIPPYVPGDMRDFAESVIGEDHPLRRHLGERFQGVLQVIVTDDVTSPRQVIGRVNDFVSVYQMALARESKQNGQGRIHRGDVTDHVELLGRITMIRDEYPDFYASLMSDHMLLESVDRFLHEQKLSETQRDVLLRHGIVKEASINSETADEEEDSPREAKLVWAQSTALRDYLVATARQMRGIYPDQLTALIHLSHSPSGRVIGSERVSRLVAVVRRGDKESVRREVVDSPVELHEHLGAELVTLVRSSTIPDLPNVIAGSAAAIEVLQSGAGELADITTRAVIDAPQVLVDPKDIVTLLLHSSESHRSALSSRLVTVHGQESPEDLDERMRIAAKYMGSPDGDQSLAQPISEYLHTLKTNAGWDVGLKWLDLSKDLSRQQFAAFLDDHLLPVCIELAGSARTFDLDGIGADLLALAKRSESSEKKRIADALSGFPETDIALLTLAVRLVDILHLPASADLCIRMAHLVANSSAEFGDRELAVGQLAESVPVWAVSSEDEERQSLGEIVADSVATHVESEEGRGTAVRRWLDAVTGDEHVELASPVVERALTGIQESISADSETALRYAYLIHGALDDLTAEDQSSVTDALSQTAVQISENEDHTFWFLKGTLKLLCETDAGIEILRQLTSSWPQIASVGGKRAYVVSQLVNQLHIDCPTEYSRIEPQLFQTLSIANRQQPMTEERLRLLAVIEWEGEELEQFLQLADGQWDSVPPDAETSVYRAANRGIAEEREVPTGLLERLADALCGSPDREIIDIGVEAWSGFTSEQRARVAACQVGTSEFHRPTSRMTDGELAMAVVEAINLGSIDKLVAEAPVAAEVWSSAAAKALLQSIEVGAAYEHNAIELLLGKIRDTEHQRFAEELFEKLPRANDEALAVVRILNGLNYRLPRRKITGMAVRMLDESTEALAYELGLWVGAGKLPNDINDGLARLREGGRQQVAQAFVDGRQSR